MRHYHKLKWSRGKMLVVQKDMAITNIYIALKRKGILFKAQER